MQRIVAADKYYGASDGRFDTVLVVKIEYSRFSSAAVKQYCCWCARVLRSRHIKDSYLHNAQHLASGKRFREGESRDLYWRLCFVQWYKILNKDGLPIDNISRVLNCMRITSEQNPGELHALSAGEAFCFAPLKSIRSAKRCAQRRYFGHYWRRRLPKSAFQKP